MSGEWLPLELVGDGEWAEVADVCGEPGWVGRLAELGLRIGCRLSLRGEAAQILVRPVSA